MVQNITVVKIELVVRGIMTLLCSFVFILLMRLLYYGIFKKTGLKHEYISTSMYIYFIINAISCIFYICFNIHYLLIHILGKFYSICIIIDNKINLLKKYV